MLSAILEESNAGVTQRPTVLVLLFQYCGSTPGCASCIMIDGNSSFDSLDSPIIKYDVFL